MILFKMEKQDKKQEILNSMTKEYYSTSYIAYLTKFNFYEVKDALFELLAENKVEKLQSGSRNIQWMKI